MWIMIFVLLVLAVGLSLILGGWAAPFATIGLLAVGGYIAWRSVGRGGETVGEDSRGEVGERASAAQRDAERTPSGATPEAPEPEPEGLTARVEKL